MHDAVEKARRRLPRLFGWRVGFLLGEQVEGTGDA
jgi:hypothetical protein